MAKVSEVYMVYGLESSTFPDDAGDFRRVVTDEVDIVEGEVYSDQARLLFARAYDGEVEGDTLYIRRSPTPESINIILVKPSDVLRRVIARVFGKEYHDVKEIVVDTKLSKGLIDGEEVEADALVISGNMLAPVKARVEVDETGRAVVRGTLKNVAYESKTIYVFP